ncbi:MAG: molecular chaperone DnaJ [Mycobacteriales bacterium]
MSAPARDYYALLGVSRDASAEELKRAYRKLARELHPDVNADPAAQQRFKDVSAAYEVLSDPAKREIVDLGGDPLAPGGGNAGAQYNMGFQDIMDAFFGGGAGAGRGRGPRTRARPGSDALIRLDLDLAEAAFGVSRDITVDTAVLCTTCVGSGTAQGTQPVTCESCGGRGEVQSVQRSFLGQVMTSRPCSACQGFGTVIPHPCPDCGGDGRVRSRRSLSVKVPAGVEDGMRIRLSGQGEVGPSGGPPGDLYVEIRERPHELFTRDGEDLHCDITVPMTAAALGTGTSLQTLDGEEEIEIRPGTQSGTVITLRARGVPRLRATGRGDLHVHISVITPSRLDAEQEELLRKLAALRGEEQAVASVRANGGLFSRLWGAR